MQEFCARLRVQFFGDLVVADGFADHDGPILSLTGLLVITSLRTSNLAQTILTHWLGRGLALTTTRKRASDSGLLVVTRYIKSAGINRHVVGNERVLQGRSSETTLTPSLAAGIARCQSKRRQGHRRAGLLSFEKSVSGCRPRLIDGKATRAFALDREWASGPA